MQEITITGLTKRFGDVTAVDQLDLSIRAGEFVTLLGPSGCGKTTTLRCIAGLEESNEGEIRFGDRVVFSAAEGINVTPGKRGLGLVFQNYALWPHMTVFKNVGFGLAHRGLDRNQILEQVEKILELLGLGGYAERFPSELSGGQQQRVAIARMVVAEPQILLFDEPLSNLDAKLRMTLRAELKRLHSEIKATTVYVTHDQLEALTLSSRITVMREGEIQHLGTPREVYHFPANLFVAEFMGNPTTNFLPAHVQSVDGRTDCVMTDGSDHSFYLPASASMPIGQDITIAVRPEDVLLSAEEVAGALPAIVYTTLPTGAECITYVKLPGSDLEIVVKGAEEDLTCLRDNQTVWLSFKRGNVFDAVSGVLVESFGFAV
jgi:multiple sugar transport system ATP-binding protein